MRIILMKVIYKSVSTILKSVKENMNGRVWFLRVALSSFLILVVQSSLLDTIDENSTVVPLNKHHSLS